VPYYVMERLVGETLGARLKRGPAFHLVEALRLAAELLEGLDAAHGIGVVHRDVKPPNIFLTPMRDPKPGYESQAKLLDFGIAKILDVEVTQLTGRGVAIGTPRYMSPEQASGDEVDGRADLYAVGLVLFEMLTGQGPFEGVRNSQVFFAHLTQPPPAISTLVGGIPPEVDRFVTSLLAKKPADRPRSAGAAAAALRSMIRTYSAEDLSDTRARPLSGVLTPAVALPARFNATTPDVRGAISLVQSHHAPRMPQYTERIYDPATVPEQGPTAAGHFTDPTRMSPERGSPDSVGKVQTERLSVDSVPPPPDDFTQAPPTRTAAPVPAPPVPVAPVPAVASVALPRLPHVRAVSSAPSSRSVLRVAIVAAVAGAVAVGAALVLLSRGQSGESPSPEGQAVAVAFSEGPALPAAPSGASPNRAASEATPPHATNGGRPQVPAPSAPAGTLPPAVRSGAATPGQSGLKAPARRVLDPSDTAAQPPTNPETPAAEVPHEPEPSGHKMPSSGLPGL
jgi:serine/threonine-protein kinase